MRSRYRSERGLTLIEMLVTMAVLGIIMSLLASLYHRMTTTMRSVTVRAETVETLTIVSQEIGANLNNLATNNDVMDTTPFRLVAIDGDNKYENSLKTHHRKRADNPNDVSDRIHFFVYYGNSQIGSDHASERAYFAYWINGKSSPKPHNVLKNRYGILRRRAVHSREDRSKGFLVPRIKNYSTGDDVSAPLLDLNESETNHSGINVLGLNIDYLSFRFYDPKDNNDPWKTSWDSQVKGYYPSVVQFAVRGYDKRANEGIDNEELMDPIWYESSVALNVQ